MFSKRGYRSLKQQPPFVQKRDMGRKAFYFIQFVGGHQDGGFACLLQKPIDDFVARQRIEPA